MRFDRGRVVRGIGAVLCLAGLALTMGCGGRSESQPISVFLTTSASSVNPGGAVTITAAVANDSSNRGVSWSLSPNGFGSFSNETTTSVTYTAPSSVPRATTVTITATSNANLGATATVQILVQASGTTISLSPAAPQTIDQGQQLSINATVANDPSNQGAIWSLSGAGSLSNPTPTSVTYLAPSSVSSNTPVKVTAASAASPGVTASLEVTVFPSGAGPNVAALNIEADPTGAAANTGFVSLTICEPGTVICQTVDDIQVDTGSEGLRILQSAVPSLLLLTLTDSSGNTIDNCVSFLDTTYLWGPVQQADIKIGGESASQTLVQTISSANTVVPTACTNGGTVNKNTPQLLGANGILGVGPEPTDCILAGADFCNGSVSSTAPPVYFACPSSGCAANASPVFVTEANQVTNPIVLFGSDSNGDIINLPPLAGAAAAVSGSLIFGIATQANNGLGSATIFGMDTSDNFITLYNGQTLTASFIDSGSNGLFFPSTITVCSDNPSFYCPPSLTAQQATNEGASGTPTNLVNFSVDNADNLFNNNPNDFAFSTLAGPQGTVNTCSNGKGSCTFDWGMPFFYGRTVFTAIDGQNVSGVGTGPFWAY
jgi:uncharacterized protein DUF3443